MKKLLIVMMALLCAGLLASCNKEETDTVDFKYLTDVKWQNYKAEYRFDGKFVAGVADEDIDMTSYTVYGKDSDGNDMAFTYYPDKDTPDKLPYTLIPEKNIIVTMVFLIPFIFKVSKLTKDRFVADMYMGSLTQEEYTGGVVAAYKERQIHFDSSKKKYWYKAGEDVVTCSPMDSDDLTKGWTDATRYYLKRID